MTAFRPAASACASVLAALLLASPARAGDPSLPPGFIAGPIGSQWQNPVALAFLDGSRLLVAEKRGLVWLVEDNLKKNVVLDIQSEALNNGDRGLLGMVIDPQFATNGLLYLLLV